MSLPFGDVSLTNGTAHAFKYRWCFSQVKGAPEEVNEDDIISCVEFDKTGDFLATGDRGGRIVIFNRSQQNKQIRQHVNYDVYCTFTSHEPEFDYLKSLEIEEKINRIRWLPQTNRARFLLSTNDKTIKLWRITEQRKRAIGYNFCPAADDCADGFYDEIPPATSHIRQTCDLRVPHYEEAEPVIRATPRRVFSNAHAYLINSLSVNSDQETFLSADDLRINLWNLQVTDQSFNIVDIKPANMEDLSEVITSAQFHPTSCSLFVYSSSKGTIRLCDMRQRALCDQHALSFEEVDDATNRSFFSEIINSISDLNFSHSGRFILSRDYLTLKVWDLNMTRHPVATYPVHDYFRGKLCTLYENDCIFDKFECQWSPDDEYVMTGSYNNYFRIFQRATQKNVLLEASREAMGSNPHATLRPRRVVSSSNAMLRRPDDELSVECMDFARKLLHLSWHPQENIVALTGTSSLYLIEKRLEEDVDSDVHIESEEMMENGDLDASGDMGDHV